MSIQGIEGLTVGDLHQQVQQGGKFVRFGYAMSFLVVSLKRESDIMFIKPGESAFVKGLPYTLLSFFIGWWGFPWGLVYTPWAIIQNLSGGRDVTADVMHEIGASIAQQGLPSVQVK